MPLSMATQGEIYVIQRITGKDETKHFFEKPRFSRWRMWDSDFRNRRQYYHSDQRISDCS